MKQSQEKKILDVLMENLFEAEDSEGDESPTIKAGMHEAQQVREQQDQAIEAMSLGRGVLKICLLGNGSSESFLQRLRYDLNPRGKEIFQQQLGETALSAQAHPLIMLEDYESISKGNLRALQKMMRKIGQAEVLIALINTEEAILEDFSRTVAFKNLLKNLKIAKGLGTEEFIIAVLRSNQLPGEEEMQKTFAKIRKCLESECRLDPRSLHFVDYDQEQAADSPYPQTESSLQSVLKRIQFTQTDAIDSLRMSVSWAAESGDSQIVLGGEILAGSLTRRSFRPSESPDLVVVCANGQIVPAEVVDIKDGSDEKIAQAFASSGYLFLRCVLTNHAQFGVNFIEEMQGSILATSSGASKIYASRTFKVEIELFPQSNLQTNKDNMLWAGKPVTCIFQHSLCENAVIVEVIAEFDERAQKARKSVMIHAGCRGIAVIQVQHPICIDKDFAHPILTNFTLICKEIMLGFGKIMKLKPCDHSQAKMEK